MATTWITEDGFDLPGAVHMARDEALARERIANADLPNVLRLYSWTPAAVSIGYQQSMDAIDLTACSNRGVDVVRRPTGGRAVLHSNELTYAVVMRSDAGIYRTHNMIVEALLGCFEPLGATLDITSRSAGSHFRTTYATGALTNAACFASTARHEATWNGKKVIGSAQRRFGDVVLQHGSILLTDDHLLLPDLLNLSEDERLKMLQLLTGETATLSEICGRQISIEEAASAVQSNFVRLMENSRFGPSDPLAKQDNRIQFARKPNV